MMAYLKTIIIPALFMVASAVKMQKHNLSEFSFMALIGTHTHESQKLTSVCSGCVVTPKIILTTAHCYKAHENWIAIAGTDYKNKYLGKIRKWIIHPNYVATVDATYNDLALTVLHKKIDFGIYKVKPLKIPRLPPLIMEHDLNCIMVGWKIENPENLTTNTDVESYLEQSKRMNTLYSFDQRFLSPRECEALLNLVPDVEYKPVSTVLCAWHLGVHSDSCEIGYIGSPIFCKVNEHEIPMFVGMKLTDKDLDNGVPWFFIDFHKYREYVENTIADPNAEPRRYFCSLKVCNKKYNVAGEYCLIGDVEDCFIKEMPRNHYFPAPIFGSREQKLIPVEITKLCTLFSIFYSFLH